VIAAADSFGKVSGNLIPRLTFFWMMEAIFRHSRYMSSDDDDDDVFFVGKEWREKQSMACFPAR